MTIITTEMSNEEYHSLPDSISKSGLDLIARSPAHYRYAERREPTRAMVIGSAIHAAILEPDVFATEYLLLREITDRRSSEYKQAVKVHDPERVLTGKEADFVSGMQESVRANRAIMKLLDQPGRAELSVITKDPVTGVGVRCRFDWLTDSGVPLDLKKTQDARPDAFARSVQNYRYHVQAAFYEDVWFWATGERLERMRFAAMEERMPHATVPYLLDDEAYAEGRRLYREALNTYADCLERDEWPAYDDDEQWLCLPQWAVGGPESEDNEEIF